MFLSFTSASRILILKIRKLKSVGRGRSTVDKERINNQCGSALDPCRSWGGGKSTVNVERINNSCGSALGLCGSWEGGRSTVNFFMDNSRDLTYVSCVLLLNLFYNALFQLKAVHYPDICCLLFIYPWFHNRSANTAHIKLWALNKWLPKIHHDIPTMHMLLQICPGSARISPRSTQSLGVNQQSM